MDKPEAILAIAYEARRDKITNVGAKRVVRALTTLGFEGQELIRALFYLEFCREDGSPYGEIKRIW